MLLLVKRCWSWLLMISLLCALTNEIEAPEDKETSTLECKTRTANPPQMKLNQDSRQTICPKLHWTICWHPLLPIQQSSTNVHLKITKITHRISFLTITLTYINQKPNYKILYYITTFRQHLSFIRFCIIRTANPPPQWNSIKSNHTELYFWNPLPHNKLPSTSIHKLRMLSHLHSHNPEQ